MQLAHAALPRFELDPKRIAATTAVIALHIGVLMMLMMPAQAPTPAEQEKVTTVIEWLEAPPPPPPPPPPPHQPHPTPVAQHVQVPVPVADPPPVNLDAPPSLLDTPPVEAPIEANTFDTQPQPQSFFQQLATVAAPAPPYPRMAVTRNLEGTVMLRIHVSATGEPLEVSVENSSGSPLLDQAAQKFVKARWRFVPAQQNGQATDAWALVPIEFVLH